MKRNKKKRREEGKGVWFSKRVKQKIKKKQENLSLLNYQEQYLLNCPIQVSNNLIPR